MEEIESQGPGALPEPAIDRPIERLRALRRELRDKTGLSIFGFYSMVGQGGTNGPGDLVAGSGDLDLLARWTCWGRETEDFGQILFDAEYRHSIGDMPVSALGSGIGALQGTVNGFNDRGFVIRNFHFIQRVLGGKFAFLVGRADPSDMGGGHAMQNVNTMFLNRAFSSAPTVAFPGFGFSAGASVRPVDWYYATAGAANAYGDTISNDLPRLAKGDFFSFFETGFTPAISSAGAGRYRFFLWDLDAQPGSRGDWGFSLIADQELGDSWQVFARYGWAQNGVTGVKSSAQVGAGWRDFGRVRGNLAGLAFSVSEASSGGGCEKVLEAFLRVQVNTITQATLGVQGIFDPPNSEDMAAAVFSGRLRVAF